MQEVEKIEGNGLIFRNARQKELTGGMGKREAITGEQQFISNTKRPANLTGNATHTGIDHFKCHWNSE